jgi:toxin ParE1/3/4
VRVRWLPQAQRDLQRQLEYVAERDPNAATALSQAVATAATRLIDHPKIGRPGRLRSTRELVVTRTPYVVIYRVEPSEVVILRVLHGAQRWPPR